MGVSALTWQNGMLALLDQRFLPQHEAWLECRTAQDVADAISSMVVRGAPAIGIAAAYGAVLSAQNAILSRDWKTLIRRDLAILSESRPTAVNLNWAIQQMKACLEKAERETVSTEFLSLADKILDEDIQANLSMAENATGCFEGEENKPFSVMTHCNTGSLATGGYGTALGVIRNAWRKGFIDQVYAGETRPWLQGARLTAWELERDGIPVTLNADGAASWLMANRPIKWVIVGADRITAYGDVANKIGTYSLAVLARHHGVRFMVVAPSSTVDMDLDSGSEIEIEMRSPDELTRFGGQLVAPSGVQAINPVFDITPAGLIDAIVTEKGVIEHPDSAGMAGLFG